MSAGDKIEEGLKEALAIARGEARPARTTKVDPGRATEARLRRMMQKRDAFLATAIGRAFREFDAAHSEACRVEVEQTYEPFPKLGIVRGKQEAEKAARTELLKLLYEAAGVGEYDDGR